MIFRLGPDIRESILREREYQERRGFRAVRLRLSPEAHEALRLQERAPKGAVLREVDGVPVVIEPTFTPGGWRWDYDAPAPPQEKLIDARRKNW